MSLGEFQPTSSTKWLMHLNGNANDSSGNWYNWTASNVTRADGFLWQWGSFNGTTSDISYANNLWITWGNITMIGWAKFAWSPSNATWRCIASQWDTGTQVQYNMVYHNNVWWGTQGIQFARNRNSSATNQVLYTVTLSTSAWHMIALTYDWTNIIGYLNWIAVGSTASSGSGSSWWSSHAQIGKAWTWFGDYYLSGLVDEVIIENRAWTAAELQKYYTYTKWRFASL